MRWGRDLEKVRRVEVDCVMASNGGVDVPLRLLSVNSAQGMMVCLAVATFLLKAANWWLASTQ